MGNDIRISLPHAVAAGAQVVVTSRMVTEYDHDGEVSYQVEESYADFPCELRLASFAVTDESFIVTANTWGSSYEPLMAWLASNSVPYTEI